MSESVGPQVGKVCPSCGREESIPLLWGLPDTEAIELAERGLVALGGCMVMPDEPTLVCRACGAHWGSNQDVDDGDLRGLSPARCDAPRDDRRPRGSGAGDRRAGVTAQRFPEKPTFASHAEQLFADALLDHLPDDAVVFCGQRFSDRKQDREADLIVAWPGVGIAVIEVKGGSVYLADGEWRQSGRTRDKPIHPVDQARICK